MRAIAGPQHDIFFAGSVERFFSSPYTVTARCDRTGMRLGRGGGSYDRALARVGPGILTVVAGYAQIEPGTITRIRPLLTEGAPLFALGETSVRT